MCVNFSLVFLHRIKKHIIWNRYRKLSTNCFKNEQEHSFLFNLCIQDEIPFLSTWWDGIQLLGTILLGFVDASADNTVDGQNLPDRKKNGHI